MIVYHGSFEVVEKPDTLHSYRPLDFGKGFYVTTNKAQAEVWAKRKAVIKETNKAIINVYKMKDDYTELIHKDFGNDLSDMDRLCLPLQRW